MQLVARFYTQLFSEGLRFYEQSVSDRWTIDEVVQLDPRRFQKWLSGSYKRSLQQSTPHSMTLADFEGLTLPKICPVLLEPTNLGTGSHRLKLSIDRIQPKLGYVPGNVIVVSTQANRLKSNLTFDELKLLT